jgi:SLT domain-containing protein
MLNFIVSGINTAVNAINYLIDGYNRIPVVADIPRLGILSVPAFAEGGIVSKPTLAMVGEGGEREYIIPESKMAAASANYLNGARGGAVIPAFANSGFVGGNAQINVTTGPVMQQGGQQYVSMQDFNAGLQQVADSIYKGLRKPSVRAALRMN